MSSISTSTVKRAGVMLAFVCAMGVSAWTTLEAHKGHDHMVMGTLTMVAPDHVMVKVTDAKTKQDSVKTIAVKPTTKLLKGIPGTPAKSGDLTIGTRIVVNVGEGKEPLSAKEIHIATAPAPGTK
jgi:hypothetical protein